MSPIYVSHSSSKKASHRIHRFPDSRLSPSYTKHLDLHSYQGLGDDGPRARVRRASLPATTKSLQAELLRPAQEYDISYPLSPSKSVVEGRPLQREEKPDVYIHTNPDTYKQGILASISRDAEMNAAHTIFLDSFAGACGYATYKERNSSRSTRANIAVGMAKNPQLQFTSQEKNKYVRWKTVMSCLPSIPGMSIKDAMYLVGKYAGRNKLNDARRQMPLRAVAIHLERYCKLHDDDDRTTAVLKAFSWLTGYASFEAAYKNKEETRELTEEGIAHPATVPKIPKDFDVRNKELLESLIGEDID